MEKWRLQHGNSYEVSKNGGKPQVKSPEGLKKVPLVNPWTRTSFKGQEDIFSLFGPIFLESK